MKDEALYCESCGEKLNPKRAVWLELSFKTNLWTDPEVAPWPEEDSQGGFPFGKDCAKRILANGGHDAKWPPKNW